MIEQSHIGAHCQTVRPVRTMKGNLPKNSQGIIQYEMDTLGRRLILVHWEQGFAVPVFPDEIEIRAEVGA
jgi:hypothetical protein